jgi:hypothetical protein
MPAERHVRSARNAVKLLELAYCAFQVVADAIGD